MAIRPKARWPGPRHVILARPKHGTARLRVGFVSAHLGVGSLPARPGPTTGSCLGFPISTLGRHGQGWYECGDAQQT